MTSKVEELKADVKELQRLVESSEEFRPRVRDILATEMRKLETELLRCIEATSSEAASSPDTVLPKTVPSIKCYDVKVTNYAWDQSDKFIKLFVPVKNVQSLDKQQVTCQFQSNSVELNVRGLENRNYIFTIKGLLHQIDTASSHWKIKTDTVSIFLAKMKQGTKWSHLTGNEVKSKPDFNTDDLAGDPSAGLMTMFKKMYEEGDDDMKRTIAKAWTESREKQKMDF